MDVNLIIQKPEDPDTALVTPYLSLLGSLLWIARCTRPDIYYSVIYLAQFSSCPSEQSWAALQRVAQYLHHTQHYRIIYEHIRVPLSVLTVQVYSDADHARDRVNECLSYTGGVIFVNGLLIHCQACTRQTDAEMSSTGSEYVVASVVGQRAMSVLHMLVEMFGSIRIAQQEPVSACATATSYPASDSDWMQRAARFFEDHALGVDQLGPPSPLLPRDTSPMPSAESRLHALPHADSVPTDGTGYCQGPVHFHATRSRM
ncbi:hypothetical protein CYMTET_7870 [Cymbomonas tetramitiformis]|uniref:Uncharacterized protein n=1 Tax=Cymbomonas tetramitiformis TaxID=36881 RepID=A0AAE0GUT2_9CHLO|nr:hypothetical protein CYMTET_7870 [Cymbomonas tetramitiformis]